MHRVRTTIVAAILPFLAPMILLAQESPRPEGVWIAVGAGGGLSTSSEFEGSDRFGGAFYGRLGGTISRNVLLGGEFIAWGRGQDDLNPGRGNFTLTTMYYPTDAAAVFVKGGVGVAVAALLRDHLGGTTTRGSTGLGITSGIGYHIRIGRSVFLNPNLDVLFQHFPATDDPSVTNFLILATVGLGFH